MNELEQPVIIAQRCRTTGPRRLHVDVVILAIIIKELTKDFVSSLILVRRAVSPIAYGCRNTRHQSSRWFL